MKWNLSREMLDLAEVKQSVYENREKITSQHRKQVTLHCAQWKINLNINIGGP